MDLDRKLGSWFPVKRNAWFDVYRSQTTLYWRQDDDIVKMIPSMHRGIYSKGEVVSQIPNNAHPIAFYQVNDRIWTHRPYRMTHIMESYNEPTGHIIRDSIDPGTTTLRTCSDASVRQTPHLTTCAWILEGKSGQLTLCAHIQNISSNTSYRGELEGIYRTIRTTVDRNYNIRRMQMWCDNQAAIKKVQEMKWTPSSMIQPEADIILATRALLAASQGDISLHHVYGHQDTRQRPSDTACQSPSSLSTTTTYEEEDADTFNEHRNP